MHPELKKQCRQDVTIFPFDKRVDGTRSFKSPFNLKCYSEPKVRMVKNTKGEEVVSLSTIIVDGINVDKISVYDDISMTILNRRPVINIQAFPDPFKPGYAHLEIYV